MHITRAALKIILACATFEKGVFFPGYVFHSSLNLEKWRYRPLPLASQHIELEAPSLATLRARHSDFAYVALPTLQKKR